MTSLTSEEGATMNEYDPTEYDPNSKDITDDLDFLKEEADQNNEKFRRGEI